MLKNKSSENEKKKKGSENDQNWSFFRAFLFIFFRPPTLDRKKNSCKSTNKKNLALWCSQISIIRHLDKSA